MAYPVGGLVEAVIPGSPADLPRRLAGRSPSALREAGAAGRAELRRLGEEGRRWAERASTGITIAAATEAVYLGRRLLGTGRVTADRPNHDHRRPRSRTCGGGATAFAVDDRLGAARVK